METPMALPTHTAVRYVVPLREGGSLPAVLETEEGLLFVAKFRGAGQGARALVAELIAGLLARHLGLPVPGLALLHLDEAFGRTERDPEIQDILRASRGLNAGLRYLDGAFNFDPVAVPDLVPPDFAADVVWFDAFVTNIDRTARNPNILVWQRRLWLIDHGAALYFHHNWEGLDDARIRNPFPPVRDHVLLPFAGDLAAADARLAPRLDAAVLRDVLARVPDALLMDRVEGREPPFGSADENRAAYAAYLSQRLAAPRAFADEAARAQQAQRQAPRTPQPYRR
jgi:hypothetical protein